jgi:predicted nucleic acid-binding protein
MIVLDTNVVSEPLRSGADPAVAAWLDRQVAETLYLTATSLSELLLGLELIPAGKRKSALRSALRELLDRLFGPRVLPFDALAAAVYATVLARARARGQAIGVPDGQIAAIAAVHGYAVATRDTAPFVAAGVAVVNPWQA